MNNKCTTLLATCLLITTALFAQKKQPKFKYGDVKPEDFAPASYEVDTSAGAVFLYDVGSSSFTGNNNGFFSVIFKRHVRIRLLKKSAFDLATVELYFRGKGGDAERLKDLDVTTYNLEGGKVVPTELDKSSLFKDKAGNYESKKFTFPNIREGSIIEYAYEIETPGISRIRTWKYQGEYPRLWSQYDVTIPVLFDFVFVKQGYHPYAIDTAMLGFGSFYITEPGDAGSASHSFSWSGNTVNSQWAMKDVPALKHEKYTTTVDNHIAQIEFQLSALRYPEQPVKHILHSWPEVATELMKDEDFGAGLADRNGWLDDDLKVITGNKSGDLETAKKIYEYIRNNFTCTDDAAFYRSQTLKKTFQSRKGNVVDINMLLTAMLLNKGYVCDPVLLSTRDNGKVIESYPILNKFNYLISRVEIGGVPYLLDATQPDIGFGKLPMSCYNGTGRIIGDRPYIVPLYPDSLNETSLTSVFIINDEKDGLSGRLNSNRGYMSSVSLRGTIKKSKEEEFFNNIKKSFSGNTGEVEISNSGFDSLKLLDEPVAYHYDFNYPLGDNNIIYFTPVMGEDFYKENPFHAAERFYPVEMPYCLDETYVLNMEVPKGYKVDELPKSARVNLNEDEGRFEYIVAASGDHIQLRSRLVLNKATYLPEDYQTLRDFFTYVVKKHSEQIVFKKIN